MCVFVHMRVCVCVCVCVRKCMCELCVCVSTYVCVYVCEWIREYDKKRLCWSLREQDSLISGCWSLCQTPQGSILMSSFYPYTFLLR